jgi:DNA-binding GntR family transcriptional regulator
MNKLETIFLEDGGDGPQSMRVYEALRRAILRSDLQPGAALQETELASHLQVSRTPIREAIRRLNADGLVEVIPYKGAFVKALSRTEVREIYETAEGLEGMAAWLAARKVAAEGGVERLQQAAQAMREAFDRGDVVARTEADTEFHAALHELADNAYLAQALARLREQVHRVRHLTARAFGGNAASLEEHEAACRAIADGDAELARTITQQHWERVRTETLSLLP